MLTERQNGSRLVLQFIYLVYILSIEQLQLSQQPRCLLLEPFFLLLSLLHLIQAGLHGLLCSYYTNHTQNQD